MTPTIPMPGALRWREMYPLVEGDGSCSLIYDLERAAVLDVPEELQFHVAPALEAGDLDDAMLSWLVQEDLLTTDNWGGWSRDADTVETSGGDWDLGAIHRVEDRVSAKIAPRTPEELPLMLEPVFKQSVGASHLRLCLDWGGDFPGAALAERILVESGRLAAAARQEISWHLTLDTRQVTPGVASYLTKSPWRVRVSCDPFPSRANTADLRVWKTSATSALYLDGLGDRLTVSCVLSGSARLLDLWSWAKRFRVRHLDTIRLEGGSVRDYRNDLLVVCNEIAADLEAKKMPVDFKPLTRIVRRLMGSEPPDRFHAGGGFAWASGAEPYPGLESLPPDVWDGWEGADEEVRDRRMTDSGPCTRCWARYICGHSALVTAPGEERRTPTGDRCAVWLAEAEVALRLYHRLAHCDPIAVVRYIEEPGQMPVDPLRRSTLEAPKLPF